ncbi:SNF2 family N-terminal domain-domain-containing protein [Coniella lustricola]|uniref:SNF2 family N-terminal domain-domain-containing protein n=1 Tax=Coniella lustricola TaxID=2025994 RepID=A0A2T3A8R8_9PEZI|nr:SNF2 family N-terminal domain-domain-containing protein [Coniella lustricola]
MRQQTPKEMACDLLEHQKVCLSWLIRQEKNDRKRGSLLADTMGLGKTIQALALILAHPSKNPNVKTTLLVAPLVLLHQWEREIEHKVKNASSLKTIILHGDAKNTIGLEQMLGYDIVLCTYGKLTAEYQTLKAKRQSDVNPSRHTNRLLVLHPKAKFHRIILDEAHNIKNRSGIASLAACEVNAEFRLCMTGTPLMNRADEIYPLIRFLRIEPYNEWGRFSRVIDRPIRNWKGKAVLQALRKLRVLLRGIMLRRTHDSLLDGEPIIKLPARREVDAYAVFDKEQEAYYRALESKQQLKFNKYLRQGTVMEHYLRILTLLLRLRQACDHPHLIKNLIESDDPESESLSTEGSTPESVALDPASITTGDAFEEDGPTEDGMQPSTVQQKLMQCNCCHEYVKQAVTIKSCGHVVCSKDYEELIEAELEISSSDEDFFPVFWGRQTKRIQNESRDAGKNGFVSMVAVRSHAIGRLQEMEDYRHNIRKSFVASAKTQKIMSILQTIRANNMGEKTLVFSLWPSFLDLLEIPIGEADLSYRRFDGSMNATDRDDAVGAFMTKPDIKILLLSLTAGNAGLNLTAATQVIICEPFWNPYTEEQAIGRAHRLGQNKEVTIHRVLIKNTVEDRILRLQNRKRALVGTALIAEGATAAASLNHDEVRGLLGLP